MSVKTGTASCTDPNRDILRPPTDIEVENASLVSADARRECGRWTCEDDEADLVNGRRPVSGSADTVVVVLLGAFRDVRRDPALDAATAASADGAKTESARCCVIGNTTFLT